MIEIVKTRYSVKPTLNGEQGSASGDLPPMPEFVHIGDRNVIWRNSARPKPNEPVRIITWEIFLQEDKIIIHADLDQVGEMKKVDFPEVRMRLNEILISQKMAEAIANCHQVRLRRSLYWQRTPDDDCEHLNHPRFDGETGAWSFNYSISGKTPDPDMPLNDPAIRPASNQMLLERNEERQWLAYANKCLEWAGKLSLDPAFSECLRQSRDICTARLLLCWGIPECRELFTSSVNFAMLFCSPGLVAELDDPDNDYKETVKRLASLTPGKLLEQVALPGNNKAVELFKRIAPREIVPYMPLIRSTLNNPIAVQRLSETTCSIEITMLELCGRKYFPINWQYFRQQCTNRPFIDPLLVRIDFLIDFFPYNFKGRQVRRAFRRIRNPDEFEKIFRIAYILKKNWA